MHDLRPPRTGAVHLKNKDNDALAALTAAEKRWIEKIILDNGTAALGQVRKFLRLNPDRRYLADELNGEATLAVVEAAHALLGKKHENPDAYIATCVKSAIRRTAWPVPRGYSARTLKRRKLDGIEDDFPPDTTTLNEFTVCSEVADPTTLLEVRDSLNHACQDETDKQIIRLCEHGGSPADVALHLGLTEADVKKRLKAILKRYDSEAR